MAVAVKAVVGGFSGGFFSLFGAFNLIRNNRSLLRYVAIPFIINVLVFSVTVFWGFDWFNHFIGQYFSGHEGWYWQVIEVLAEIIASLVVLVMVFFTFTVVGNLIAAPFNDILSERTEQLLTGVNNDEQFSLKQFGVDLARVMRDEVRKMAIFVALMALLLLLNLLPGLGSLIYGVCSVLLTVYFLIVEYTGYVFSRKHLGFNHQRRYIADNRFTTIGFGLAVMCMLMVPFVQFFTIPLAVVAATQICCRDGAVDAMVVK